jgi:hypothetical protein
MWRPVNHYFDRGGLSQFSAVCLGTSQGKLKSTLEQAMTAMMKSFMFVSACHCI